MRKVTIADATREWVNGFNVLPYSLIQLAYDGDNIDKLQEITPRTFRCEGCHHEVYGDEEDMDTCEKCEVESFEEVEQDSWLPMWGTLWSFDSSCDSDWAYNNLEVMASLGFRIYESDEIGLFFGIDGAGYNFYDAHWVPLYKARGLQWHDVEEEGIA